MSRRVLVAAGLVVVVLSGCGGKADVPPLPEGRFIAASHTLSPDVQLFGDPIVARVDVIVDRDRFDPDRIRIAADFAPYERDGAVARTRSDDGRFTHLRFAVTLRCLVYDCLEEIAGGPPEAQGGLPPPNYSGGFGSRHTVELAPSRVVYDDPKGKHRTIQIVRWPAVQSVSRLNFGDTEVTGVGFPFEASVTPLPALSYRFSPGAIGVGLLLGALTLLALPAVLVARVLRRDPVPTQQHAVLELSALERAVALVEWARDRSVGERREALEALAVELGAATDSRRELVEPTRSLAWSEASPVGERMDELVRTVRGDDGPAE